MNVKEAEKLAKWLMARHLSDAERNWTFQI